MLSDILIALYVSQETTAPEVELKNLRLNWSARSHIWRFRWQNQLSSKAKPNRRTGSLLRDDSTNPFPVISNLTR